MPSPTPEDPTGPHHARRRLVAAVAGPGQGPGLLLAQPPVVGAEEPASASAAVPGPAVNDVTGGVRPRLRWRSGARAAVLLCLAAMAFFAWFWWQAAQASTEGGELVSSSVAAAGAVPDTGSGPESGLVPGGASPSPAATETIIVHVAGAVAMAGIVELPQGSRLHEAIAAAGGGSADADPDQLNLAAVLEDGQKVLVPRQGETVADGSAAPRGTPTGGGPAPAGVPAPPGKINLNTAGVEELATLPRVGPVLAQRIVDWRTQHGRFQRVEELDAVEGVGEKMLSTLLPLVKV